MSSARLIQPLAWLYGRPDGLAPGSRHTLEMELELELGLAAAGMEKATGRSIQVTRPSAGQLQCDWVLRRGWYCWLGG